MGDGFRRNVNDGSSRVSPCGPAFLLYQHSDAAEFAIDLASALRSAGVPVWDDRSGLSGAVVTLTPDIGDRSQGIGEPWH